MAGLARAAELLSALAKEAYWRGGPGPRPVRGDGRRVMSYPNPGSWTVDLTHPAVERVLGSGLPVEVQGAYLASVLYSAANRLMTRVTDADEQLFVAALAGRLVDGPA
ncbi:MAG: hypothetical protein HYZ75_14585 [Elusimicrobia bacterium]|nr:hypothetical protein [Elusimicrobiota bacterium]